MLDIGFMELLLIAIIALVVLGPERLPGAIRTTVYWVGKIRRSFQNTKEELEKELNVDDIKRQIHNEAVMQELEKIKETVTVDDASLKDVVPNNKNESLNKKKPAA